MKYWKIIILMLCVIILLFISIKVDNKRDDSETIDNNISGDQTKILLYFSNADNYELVQEYRNVNFQDIRDNMYETILNELIKGPANSEFIATIPKGTKVNNIQQEGNKIIVDFSKEYDSNSGDKELELHKIYSIVDTLTEIKEIDEVEIRVEGNTIACEKRI